MPFMDRYPPISEHGLIGDLQTAALVCSDGTIDWFCCPRFDSPSVFASLLDADNGGHFRIRPDTDDYVTRQLYFPGTAILVTRFMTTEGVGEVVDFMPVAGEIATDRHRLVRLARVVRGVMRFVADLQPRFDYARQPHKVQITDTGAVFESDDMALAVHRVEPPEGQHDARAELELAGDGIRLTRTMHAGEIGGVVIESGVTRPRVVSANEMRELFVETARYWRRWLDRCTYSGRWRETVLRSAMTLKLMTYAPTGALVAAPTAG